MKKITFILVALAASALIFNGCNLFGPADNLTAVTGVLTEQAKTDEMPGTHFITTEDGDVYALSSTSLFLSSKQFIGNKVTVRGATDKDSEIFMVNGVSVLEVLEKEGGKANWVEYMNEDLGFKLKYYDDWKVMDPDTSSVFFQSSDEDEADRGTVIFDLVALDQGEDVYESMNDYLDQNGYLNYKSTEEKIGLGQIDALKIEDVVGGYDFSYFVERTGGYFYEILFDGDSTKERTLNEMLTEFQTIPMTAVEEEADDEEVEADENELVEETEDDEAAEEEEGDDEVADEPEEEVDEEVDEADEFDDEPVLDPTDDSLPEFDYDNYSSFESGPYEFRANYPKNWYYAGERAPKDGVLHKYAFSDEEVDDDNEFASLNILDTDTLPTGSVVELPNGQGVMKYVGSDVMIYTKVGNRVYMVEGAKELENILLKIAGSVTSVN